MKYTTLPNTDIRVSKLCLGTMTWGQQNTEAEGHQQLDMALEKGINFIDTAEMYPVPARKETQGNTEKIIGTWLQKSGNRDKIILASKIAGPGRAMAHIRPNLGFSKAAIDEALELSLQRLNTDYLDLYQLHWPERNSNYFGKRGYKVDEDEEWQDNFSEILNYLDEVIKSGKVRHIGLSNESPYGVMRCLEEARKGSPRIITVQNPYNLLNRKDEIGLTEIYHRENIGLLPYSPLGMGTLTGKYLNKMPENARLTLFPQYSRYSNAQALEATKRYCSIAEKHSLKAGQMALAFLEQQPFVSSTIIGATSLEQLEENIESIKLELSEEVLQEIDAVHEAIPNPAP
ncbi:NADP(H)-dependent aldo-keto reductase [Antarcticibacterium arcticum]|uniref:Protein tas n=1 Tax=Antarcticibacterium arcticum TaxID=2585771 RepID=A0A5B8YL21_9FLAO|nr:NADP(H)-dependent aldo-keto reductase [Antarcticibacterium arcticum]QED38311.1 NADP(H)-dependent aldo-keto reductase [Antarcticibacterium arcticum]